MANLIIEIFEELDENDTEGTWFDVTCSDEDQFDGYGCEDEQEAIDVAESMKVMLEVDGHTVEIKRS